MKKPFIVCLVLVLGAGSFIHSARGQSTPAASGGNGDASYYILRNTSGDNTKFDQQNDYVRIDAVSWFVNKQGNWIKSVIASGSVSITVDGTAYSFPLGGYALAKGAKTAPIFELPLIPTTPWDGSPITFGAKLVGLRNDTTFGAILQQLANTAVSYGSAALGTASFMTAYPGLSQVSSSLTQTADSLVQKLGSDEVPIFDQTSGIAATLYSQELYGNQFFILFYKGRQLDQSRLDISTNDSGVQEVLENGKKLQDGAWILFRVTRENNYAGPRPWTDQLNQALNQLDVQMKLFQADPTTGDTVIKSLQNTGQNTGKPQSLGDQFTFIGNLINQDMALTEKQRLAELTRVGLYPTFAKKAIQGNNAEGFFNDVATLENPGQTASVPALTTNVLAQVVAKTAKVFKLNFATNFLNVAVTPSFISSTLNLNAAKISHLNTLQAEQEAFKTRTESAVVP
ncbi:MAG TPA: hypothetical protein VH280_06950 [Verrucomicrobiae bacterium]|jgi:hypothetical protein|nr:hypothetical protein [Verrucomicrobiae bacterium]